MEGDVKSAVLRFIKAYYEKHRKVPALRLMCREIEGLTRSNFYNYFHGCLTEACRLGDVPEPEERIKVTQRTLKG